jgi:hypothetical protein
MGNFYIVLLIIFGLIWGGALFTGFVKGMRKGLESQPRVGVADSQKLREKQERIVEDAEYQRKRMMDDYKQKMRDQERMGF